jgi:hypothetical protein
MTRRVNGAGPATMCRPPGFTFRCGANPHFVRSRCPRATDHYPTVRIELWDDAPPDDAKQRGWDQIVNLTCDLTTEVRLQSVTATPGEHTLRIPQPGRHHARVTVGNQADTAELGDGSFETAVERWLIQLWPA